MKIRLNREDTHSQTNLRREEANKELRGSGDGCRISNECARHREARGDEEAGQAVVLTARDRKAKEVREGCNANSKAGHERSIRKNADAVEDSKAVQQQCGPPPCTRDMN